MKALLIPVAVNEAPTEVEFDVNDFDAIARAIGAEYVEFVALADRHHRMVVDETGRLKGLPINERATYLYPAPIVGPALIVGWDTDVDYDDEDATELSDHNIEIEHLSDYLSEWQR